MLKLEKMGLRFKVSKSYKAENGVTNLTDLSRFLNHDGNTDCPRR